MKIWAKTKEFSEGKFLVVRRDGSVPHWPHFVLGARDPAAPKALLAYAKEAERIGTYILASEDGASIKAAGWRLIGEVRGRSWSCPSRPRVDRHPTQGKLLFEASATPAPTP